MNTLVIRSARLLVLRQYLARYHNRNLTLLTSPLSEVPEHLHCLIETPPGPLSWDDLPVTLRDRIRLQRWDEIVVLHNRYGAGYARILEIARRVAPKTPTRIFYAGGGEETFKSAMAAEEEFLARERLARGRDALIRLLYPPLLWLARLAGSPPESPDRRQ